MGDFAGKPRRKWVLDEKKRISECRRVMRWLHATPYIDGGEKRKKMLKSTHPDNIAKVLTKHLSLNNKKAGNRLFV